MARILIAEDEQDLRTLLARALAQAGHDAVAVADGTQALEALEQARFDLLLADIKMPLMDGIALALTVARDYPALPIVLMTGFADQRARAAGLDALIRSVLVKPFTVAELNSAVTAALAA